ncbi:MAG: hypothetical protein QXS54_06660 [Candidatus Methanomethylicaceae archaeon]
MREPLAGKRGSMTEDLLRQAISAIKAGDKARGKQLLAQVLRQEPRNELAWLWLSQCVTDYEQKLYCIKRVLEINPDNRTAQKLLTKIQASSQTQTQPAPPTLQQKKRTKASSLLLYLLIAIVIGCGCLFGIAVLSDRSASDNNSNAAASEQAYLEEMYDITLGYKSAFAILADLSKAVGENPYLLLDNDWRTQSTAVIAAIRRLNARVRSIDPPYRFLEVHRYMIDSANHFDKFADLFIQGLEDFDSDKIMQANTEMQLGLESVEKATEKLNEIFGPR